MAVYTRTENPGSVWRQVMGSSYVANIFVITITNSDTTLTEALGSFVLINGFVFSGTITELRRTNAGVTIESITGLSVDALAFVSASPGSKLSLAFAGADTLSGHSGHDNLAAGAQNDEVHGNGGNDLLAGNDGDDALHGDAGMDELHGDAGNDVMAGGPGNDDFFVTDAGDVVVEAPGEGEDRVYTALASYTLPANVERLTFQTSISHTGTGNDLDNGLSGAGAKDTLYGLGGDDIFATTGGGDTFLGGPGDDVFQVGAGDVVVELAGEGTDEVRTSIEGYVLPANVEVLRVPSGSGDVFGNELDNRIILETALGRNAFGLAGNDIIETNAVDNRLDGGVGDDTAVFHHALDTYALADLGSKIIASPSSGLPDTLYSIEHLQFEDGTIHVNDGDALFDTAFYMRGNLDVFHAGGDALAHFIAFGWHEGRDPNPLFDVAGYLALNKDVAAAGVNPLEHYRHSGWREGRDPGPGFDVALYLLHNPDVAAAGVDPLGHYLQHGAAEGRAAHMAVGAISGGFDAQYYLFANPDVAAAGVDALTHYKQFGWQEGRDPNGWFDTEGYLTHYADVAAAGVNPLEHYLQFGWKERRDPSAGFDTLNYLAANPDVAAAGVNPLGHFLTFGIYEGRKAVNDGVWH